MPPLSLLINPYINRIDNHGMLKKTAEKTLASPFSSDISKMLMSIITSSENDHWWIIDPQNCFLINTISHCKCS